MRTSGSFSEACPLFADLARTSSATRAEVERLLSQATVHRFGRGSALFHEDDPAGRLFVVVSGAVRVFRVCPTGEEIVPAVLTAGDLFGELSLFDSEPTRSADADALEATVCLTLPSAPVRALVAANPQALVRL